MIDIDTLEALAKAAGGDAWTPTYATRTDLASVWLPDGDSVCRCHGNIGHWPEPIDADDVAEFIAAANPAAILALIAEVRALREFHGFFRDRCERLFGEFGMDAIDLYNAAAVAARAKEQA